MKKSHIYTVGGIILVAALIIGFSYKGGIQSDKATSTIKLGAVISLSGPAASFGEHAKNGMELAVQEINNKGGIEGRKVEMVYEDDGTDPKNAVSAFKKLVSVDKVQGVVGGLWDFLAQPLFPLALEHQVTFISPSNFRIEGGVEPTAQSFMMLTEFNKVLVGAKDFLKREDVKKVAVVHFKSVFGTEIARSFNEMSVELGKGSIVDESYTEIGSNDFKTVIAKLKQEQVDTVFLDTVDVDTVNFLRRSRELGFTPKFMTYVGSYDAFAESDKGLLEGITILDWEFSTKEFATKYEKAYGKAPAKSAERAYDAVYVLADAIAHADNTASVASYIESHTFKTPSNTVKFLSTHEVESTPVKLETYRGGKLVPLEK